MGWLSDRTVTLSFLAAILGCRAGDDRTTTSRRQVGDTIFVTNTAPVWGRPARLVEEVRIGRLNGPDHELFTSVYSESFAIDTGGGCYVFDGQVPAIRHFARDGRYLGTVGRSGAGPGEYRKMIVGMVVLSDGRLAILDPRNFRVSFYSADGKPSGEWPAPSGFYSSQMLVRDDTDNIYVKVLATPSISGYVHYDPAGRAVDTLLEPSLPTKPSEPGGMFAPSQITAFHQGGFYIAGVNSQYSFDLLRRGKPVIRVTRPWAPIELQAGERADLDAQYQWALAHPTPSSARPQPARNSKPAYEWIAVGDDGRIWVLRHSKGVKADLDQAPPGQEPLFTWTEPRVFDVFEADGTYLGEVGLPRGARALGFKGDDVWGAMTGAQGEAVVIRWRIERPPA